MALPSPFVDSVFYGQCPQSYSAEAKTEEKQADLGCSNLRRSGLCLRGAEQPSHSLVLKYCVLSTSGTFRVLVSWPLK